MKKITKLKILEWIWKWSCKILNVKEQMPIYAPIGAPSLLPIYDTHVLKVQTLECIRTFSRNEMDYYKQTSIEEVYKSDITKKMAEELLQRKRIKIEFAPLRNGGLEVKGSLRIVSWKEE